ncbi:MAG: sulfatase-like hydrolase/transferase [Anaerolineae bacterium]|jgi:arylsulfatase A-like enzyme|nr:sulfatase-like hydrolase/transferase [Chloroflexota bacterium]
MNFVFFFPDEMRADSVSCYGHPLVQMPHYDRVAAEGVRFEQCHVQHTVCSPSRCSLMTGWYPHVAGHRSLWNLLRPEEPSLFGYLRQAGYQIHWYGKNDLYSPEATLANVDVWETGGYGHAGPPAFGPEEAAGQSFLSQHFPHGASETSDMQNVARGLEFLRKHKPGDPPFFLYLPLSMPHPPYGAPEPWHSMYDPEDVEPLRPAGLQNKPDYYQLIRRYRRLEEVDESVLRKIRAVYLGMNSYVDWMLGQLLETLEETGLAEDTTLIMSSDHGDWAGDYGLVEKWPSALDDCLTRVPLLIRAPGNAAGHVVQEPMELMDVMATVLELAGVPARHTHFSRSLVPQLQGAPGGADWAAWAEGGYDLHEPQAFEGRPESGDLFRRPGHIYYVKGLQQQEHPESVCRCAMLRTATLKLVRRTNGQHELYDLVADPQELHNRYGDPALAERQADLEGRMLDWLVHSSDVVLYEHPRGLPPADVPAAAEIPPLHARA